MSVAAATALHVKGNKIGGVNPSKKQCQLTQPTSKVNKGIVQQSPLRLFAPRSLTVNNHSTSIISGLRRRLKFGQTEELGDAQVCGSVITIQEGGDDEKSPIEEVRSPYRSATSSDNTPNSITDELTIVPEPHEIRKELQRVTSEQQSTVNKENSTPVVFGPQTSKSVCAVSKTASRAIPQSEDRFTPQTNGVSSRKRLLSDRGEQECKFPVIDRTLFIEWNSCTLIPFERESGVGLHNPLNNCFLNSVLQAVVHIPQLARMVLEGRDLRMCTNQPPPNNCFHCALRNHIHRAITNTSPLHTNWINSHLRKIFPHHRSGTQEDAHEMLTLLLGALEPFPSKKANLKIHGTQGPGPSTSVEQIFGGSLRNLIVCNVCSNEHLNYERIREINLGLTRKYQTDVIELIHDFFKPEVIQNFLCTSCKQKRSATRYTSLLRAPSVLIIQLKRFNVYGGKNRLDVRPKPRVDLTQYTMKKESIIYDLNGIIEHIGGGINFGHYICAMRGFKGNWFKFDDSERRRVSLNDVVQNMDPYILFYTKISPSPINQQPHQRRSFGGFAPSTPKQARLNSFPSHNGGTSLPKRFNNTFHRSFIS
ncbi:hypothetical protein niasHS_002234 [Heterodera schachtii]|uniref:Ubiquitin carboxyl-terminal hydrolase 36 n=1 Tax=Heterodera schachtii TaxID=97005 RepID=A0ABD2KMN6_HETSC